MSRFFLFFLFVFLLAACKPSLYEIQQYETSQEIKESTLLVQLKDERENIELLEKYDRPKKAARLEKETEQYNIQIKNAFKNYYSFSEYKFILQKEWIDSINGKIKIVNEDGYIENLDAKNFFYGSFNSIKRIEDDKEFDATTIVIKELMGKTNSFKRVLSLTTHDAGRFPNFNHLAKFINNRLEQLEKKRKKSLEVD